MPGGYQIQQGLCNPQDVGVTLGNGYSNGTSIPPSATANTKGSWTQLIASTSYDCNVALLRIYPNPEDTPPDTLMLDIGIGASGSEVAILPNLFSKSAQYAGGIIQMLLPLSIPAGTRIAARSQASAASSVSNFVVSLELFSGEYNSTEGITAFDDIIGLSGSPPNSVAVTPTPANTKTAWTQLQASTTRDYAGLLVLVDNQGVPDTTNYPGFATDIGIGASGSEVAIITNISGLFSDKTPCAAVYVPVNVPAGSRLSTRSSIGPAVLAGSKVGVAIYGAYL
jgi:hypothetical protein